MVKTGNVLFLEHPVLVLHQIWVQIWNPRPLFTLIPVKTAFYTARSAQNRRCSIFRTYGVGGAVGVMFIITADLNSRSQIYFIRRLNRLILIIINNFYIFGTFRSIYRYLPVRKIFETPPRQCANPSSTRPKKPFVHSFLGFRENWVAHFVSRSGHFQPFFMH